jgi:hypothetical protein
MNKKERRETTDNYDRGKGQIADGKGNGKGMAHNISMGNNKVYRKPVYDRYGTYYEDIKYLFSNRFILFYSL